jgi:hypothetical protein
MLDFGGDAGRRPPREKEADPESSISVGYSPRTALPFSTPGKIPAACEV